MGNEDQCNGDSHVIEGNFSLPSFVPLIFHCRCEKVFVRLVSLFPLRVERLA